MRATCHLLASLCAAAILACQPPHPAAARPREASPPPASPPESPAPDVAMPLADPAAVAAEDPAPPPEPIVLDRPRAAPSALCPAPLRCDQRRRAFDDGPIREVVVLAPRGGGDVEAFAMRTARGWFGSPLDPRLVEGAGRSQHTPGSSVIDLNLSTSNRDGVELLTVSRGVSSLPGTDGRGSASHLRVRSTFCKVNDGGAVVCVNRGTVFSRECGGDRASCAESGTRPAGLSDG
jgi:hypothetical protein